MAALTPNAPRQTEAPHRRVTAPLGKFSASSDALCVGAAAFKAAPSAAAVQPPVLRTPNGTAERHRRAPQDGECGVTTGSDGRTRGVPTADGADRADGPPAPPRPAPPLPALCARPPRAAPRASPAAAPRRSRRAAHGTGSGGGDGRRAAGTAGGQRPERPEPRPERTLTKSSMTGSLSPSFSPLTGTDSAMLQPSPPLASPAAATAVGTEPPPFASPAPRDCGPPRPAPQRTAPRGREWGAGPEARAWSDWRRSQKGGGDNGVGARLNSGAVGAEVGGANVGVGGDKAGEGVANAELGGASALWAVPVGDVGGAKGAGRGQRSGRLGGRGRLSSSLGTAPCAPPGGGERAPSCPERPLRGAGSRASAWFVPSY